MTLFRRDAETVTATPSVDHRTALATARLRSADEMRGWFSSAAGISQGNGASEGTKYCCDAARQHVRLAAGSLRSTTQTADAIQQTIFGFGRGGGSRCG